jgi:hypothetical protein
MFPRLIFAILFLAAVVGGSAPAQAPARITIVVINKTNGRPLREAKILIGVPAGNKNSNRIRLTTDSSGKATFQFVDPAPDQFSIIWDSETESCLWTFSPEQVIKSGFVACDCGNQNPTCHYKSPPEPGQLVIFARPVSVFERMLREL